MWRQTKWVFWVVISLVLFAACSKTQRPRLVVEDPWARSSPMATEMGAIYFTLRNTGSEEDALIGVETSACRKAEIHETYQKEGGAMGMRPVEGGRVPVPPGQTVVFAPGGLHIMCIGKQVDFQEGARFSLTLKFEKHDPITVEVEVRK